MNDVEGKFPKDYLDPLIKIARSKPRKSPVLWLPMNRECVGTFYKRWNHGGWTDKRKAEGWMPEEQARASDEANEVAFRYLKEQNFPFMNMQAMLPEEQICDISGDGIHVQQYVDIERAAVLLSRLCDPDTG